MAYRYHSSSGSSLRAGFLAAWMLALAGLSAPAAEKAAEWKHVSRTGEVDIYERSHPGSDLREFKGVGTVDAPPDVTRRVLEDVKEYPKFMPFVTEARVLSGDARSRVTYQRIAPPLVGERDYIVRVNFETRPAEGGTAYISRWHAVNEEGPAEKEGVIRVKVTQGSWVLEPAKGGSQTQTTYTVFSDCGGKIPAFIFNASSKSAVAKIFAAVRKQALLPKYGEGSR